MRFHTILFQLGLCQAAYFFSPGSGYKNILLRELSISPEDAHNHLEEIKAHLATKPIVKKAGTDPVNYFNDRIHLSYLIFGDRYKAALSQKNFRKKFVDLIKQEFEYLGSAPFPVMLIELQDLAISHGKLDLLAFLHEQRNRLFKVLVDTYTEVDNVKPWEMPTYHALKVAKFMENYTLQGDGHVILAKKLFEAPTDIFDGIVKFFAKQVILQIGMNERSLKTLKIGQQEESLRNYGRGLSVK